MKNFSDELIQTSSSLKSEILGSIDTFAKEVVIFTSLGNAELPRLTGKLLYIRIERQKTLTVFPRINARGFILKSEILGRRSFEGGVYFKISKIVETGYGRTKIRKHSCPVINVICTATC